MASRFVLPNADVGDGIKPESGAKLSFFETGTSTPKNTFSDAAGLIPNSNPVISDSNGVFPDIFITGTYKVVLTDKNNVQTGFGEADPVDEFASSASSSASTDAHIDRLNPETIAIWQASTDAKLDDVVTTKEYSSGGGGGATGDVIAGTGTADGLGVVAHGTLDLSLAVRVEDSMLVKQFGADGTGSSDAQPAIQAALDSGAAEVKFGSVSNTYIINQEIILPPAITIDLESCIIKAQYTTGNVLRCFHDDTGRPVFRVKANRASIGGDGNPNSGLVGLWIDTCNFSRFSGMKFQNLDGFAITLGATGARDIINITIEDIETSTGEGIQLLSGEHAGVDYEQITTGRIKDCFFTTTNSGSRSFTVKANDFSSSYVNPNTPSSIFGLTIERCSMNPVHADGGTFIFMKATGASLIYQNNFNNCEGELKIDPEGSPTLPGIFLEKVIRCQIEFNGQMDEADGIELVNSQLNVIRTTIDGVVDLANTGRFLIVDALSHSNVFENLTFTLSQMSTDLGFSNAPLARYYFTNRIQDDGFNNRSTGLVNTDSSRVFKMDAFNLIDTNGRPVNPSVSGGSSSTAKILGNGNLELTMTSATGARFLVPDEVVGKDVVVRCKYKITSTLTGVTNWKLASSVGGSLKTPQMEITASFNDMMYMTKIDTNRFDIFSTDTQAGVVFEIEELEVYLGGFPYPHNNNPTDLIVDDWVVSPFCTTATRPDTAKAVLPDRFQILDTTLAKPIWWDSGGAVWRSATGGVS